MSTHVRFAVLSIILALTATFAAAAPVIISFSAPLTPEQEIPIPNLTGANNPQGSASATITYDDQDLTSGGQLMGAMSWSGLSTPAFMAHIHRIANPANCRPDNGRCGTGPIIVPFFMRDQTLPVGDPMGPLPTTGSVNVNVALNATQLSDIVNGLALDAPAVGALYFNLHTIQNPPGEIRGDITGFQVVPEPGTYALLSVGLASLAFLRRKRG